MGTGTAGPSLAGAFAGGLCGLLVSCYRPVRLTKQGPVKLSRGWISEICIQTHHGEVEPERAEENQDEESTGANVDTKWEWQAEGWSERADRERGELKSETVAVVDNGGVVVLRRLVKGQSRQSQTATIPKDLNAGKLLQVCPKQLGVTALLPPNEIRLMSAHWRCVSTQALLKHPKPQKYLPNKNYFLCF